QGDNKEDGQKWFHGSLLTIPVVAEQGVARIAVWSVRPRGYVGLTTPSAPALRLAQPPLLCEEGNTLAKAIPFSMILGKVTQRLFLRFRSEAKRALRSSRRCEFFL